MTRVYIGNLDPRITERELEDEFRIYGVLRRPERDHVCLSAQKLGSGILIILLHSVWVARRPPGYAFIEFDDRRDALDAVRALDGKNGWRVELSHMGKGGSRGGRGRGGDEDLKCYECGEPGHFARECSLRFGSRGCRRSPSPIRRRRSRSYDRSPHGRRSPARRHSISPPYRRGRSYSRSPPYRRTRRASPYVNGD